MRDRRVWISLGLVAALMVSLGVYYWVHKPVTPAQAPALAAVLATGGRKALPITGRQAWARMLPR